MSIGRTQQLLGNFGLNSLNNKERQAINSGLNRNLLDMSEAEDNSRKSFSAGQGNPGVIGVNKALGELWTGQKGAELVDSDWLRGGQKTVGKVLETFGAPETGAYIANSPYFSGNLGQAVGQGLSDLGLTGVGKAITGLSNGAGSAASTIANGLSSMGSSLASGASSVASGAGSILSKIIAFL